MALRPGPISVEATRWRAVWESGGGALLDGAAALLAAGMTGFETDRLDVSVPHANRGHRIDGVRLHRRRTMPARQGAGIPRVATATAAVHAASWTVSDRQAALLLCLPVQQRLVRGAGLADAVARSSGPPSPDPTGRRSGPSGRREKVLRVPLLGLRLQPDAFIEQIVRAHHRLSVKAA